MRCLRLLLAVGLVALADSTGSAADAPVALPPFMVEEAAKGPPWRYAALPGFEILSRCPEGTTRRVVEAQQRMHALLSAILPERLQVKLSVPRAIILYDEELQPAASREVIERLLRQTDAAPRTGDGPAGPFGLRAPEVGPRYHFLPNLRLWDRDAMTVFMIARRDDVDLDRLSLTQDYVAWLVHSRQPTLPLWFSQGLLALYREIAFTPFALEAEPMVWVSPEATSQLRRNPKVPAPLLPLAAFFSLPNEPAPPDAEPDRIRRWKSQAELLVRWGLSPKGGERREKFWAFVERSAVEGVNEELFRDCLGLDFAAAEAELRTFLPHAIGARERYRPLVPLRFPDLALRLATEPEIGRLKGEWERLEIAYVQVVAPPLATKYREQARRTLARSLERGGPDAGVLAVRGLCEADAGNDADALALVEEAASLGPMRPRAWYELARLRFAALRRTPEGGEGRLSTNQTAEVLRPLFEARRAFPALPEVYELIGEAWSHCAVPPKRAHLAVLDEGVRLFPMRSQLVLLAAELNLRYGYTLPAAELIQLAERIPGASETRPRLERLRTAWQAAAGQGAAGSAPRE